MEILKDNPNGEDLIIKLDGGATVSIDTYRTHVQVTIKEGTEEHTEVIPLCRYN